MAVWVDCQGGPSFYGGWACDMGVYTGVWPLQATAASLADLNPATSDEIDFYVGLPNGAHPGDPYYGLDGSYYSPVWDAYRYLNSGTPPPDSFTGEFTSHVGTGADPAPGDTPPAGAHLYVVAYAGGGPYTEPANPPEFYVPASYAAGGAGPEPAGHWSAWQDGLSLTADFSSTDGTNWNNPTHTDSVSTDGDPTPRLQAALTADIAAATAHSGLATGGNFFSPSATKFPGDLISAPLSQGEIVMNQLSINYVGVADNPGFPDPLDPLTPGVDYDHIPFDSPAYVQYESPDPASYSWPATMTVEAAGGGYSTAGDAAGMTVPSLDIRIDQLAAPIALGTAGVVSGTSIATVNIRADDEPWTDTLGNPHTITLPGGLGLSFTLAAVAAMAYSGTYDAAAGGDFAGPNGTWGWAASFTWGDDSGNALTLTWTTSRWRYWIPVASELNWHTIAGSWASISGAPMAIFTPGLGPVDYADGPA